MAGTRRFLGGLRERIPGVDAGNKPTDPSEFWFTKHYEAADNYLWEEADGSYNVIAIFGWSEDCKRAAAALNDTQKRQSAQDGK